MVKVFFSLEEMVEVLRPEINNCDDFIETIFLAQNHISRRRYFHNTVLHYPHSLLQELFFGQSSSQF